MSKLRFRVVETAFKKKHVAVAAPAERPSEYYAKYVFNKEKMFRYLPSKVYAKLIDVIDNGAPLDRSIADEVAAGMMKWALEMGVTHYTHWFHPLTEGTAEKHDAFIEHDGKGGVMEEVRRIFKPEFLNRIDDIMVFHVLNKEDIRKIVTLLLKTLEKRCAEQMEIHLTVTNAVKDFIAEKGSDNKYGARPLRRAIQSKIEDALANEILEGRVKRGDSVQVKLHKNEIAFEVKKQ